jgi:chaperone modulatory protein CbpM
MKLSKEEFLSLAGMAHETLDAWVEAEWLIPSSSSFSDIDVARARLIRELQVDFGVNEEGVGVILNLIDQLYGLRRTLMDLRQTVDPIDEQD